jgi:two-component system cell cycle response regulator
MSASEAARLRHDLRTPVNHILGYGELLMEDAEAAGRPDRMVGLARVRTAARELISLIDTVPADRLAAALGPPARRVLGEIERLGATGPAVGAGDADDLHRMSEAAGRLLRFAAGMADPGAAEPAPPEPAAAARREAGPLGGRVLLVDDDPGNREMLRRRLEREGCAVTVAAGGAEALALLDRGGADLVLLDVLMPGLSGEEVLRRLKADPRHQELPVLMISALEEQDAAVRCIEIGAEDYLPRGVDPVLLRARLGACLRKKRSRDAELEYLRHVRLLTGAAAALQAGALETAAVDEIAARGDALGNLARVFVGMAREVRARELRLAAQVAELRVEIDEARKARAVSAIVESDAFQDLQRRAAELRRPHVAR